MTTEDESCEACMKDYKGKRIVKLTCQYCPSHACTGCQQQYLLQTYEDPHCMSCKRAWSSDFVATSFPLSFRNGALRQHRRKLLYEREKALLPSMQVFVQAKREMNRLHTLYKSYFSEPTLTALRKKRETIKQEELRAVADWFRAKEDLSALLRKEEEGSSDPSLSEEIESCKDTLSIHWIAVKLVLRRLKEVEREYRSTVREHSAVNREYALQRNIYYGTEQVARTEFLMKCGQEECRGFLSTSYKCGTCANWTCPDCLVVLGPEREVDHTCVPDQVATAKAIKEDTRPCPKCGTRIYKIDGCDQMWCVMNDCHTAFSWTSGNVVTGTVHNPHYYEWLRRSAGAGGHALRDVRDIPCGGLPSAEEVLWALRGVHQDQFMELHQLFSDVIYMHLPEFPERPPQGMNKNANVAYLMNELDDLAWKRALERNETKFLRRREIGQILHMLCTMVSDQIRDMCIRSSETTDGEEFSYWFTSTFLPSLEALRTYANEELQRLSVQHRMAVPQLGPGFSWKPLRALYKLLMKVPSAGQMEVQEAPAPNEEYPALSLEL